MLRSALVCVSLVVPCLGMLAPSARAGDCNGDPGWILEMPATARIGADVDLCMTGPANEMGFFMVSLGQGPVESVYGTICLDFPLALSFLFDLGAEGHVCFTSTVPCEPELIDLTLYAQFITGKPNRGISNQASITLADGICAGDVVTWRQVDWDEECGEDNLGCTREDQFATVFPNGFLIGDHGGKENDFHSALFTSAAAITGFFPANDGEAGILDQDSTDPTATSAHDFAGQLATAKLTVAFDDLGLFDSRKNRPDLKIGDMIFVADVNPDLFGLTVRDVIDICDLAISGQLGDDGNGDFDIDGDGDPDSTLSDLSNALKALNDSNQGGTINRGTIEPL